MLPWLVLAVPALRGRGEDRSAALPRPAEPGVAGSRVVTFLVIAFLLVILANVLMVAALALDRPTWNYDAICRWMFKARAFYADRSILPHLVDVERAVAQLHYPPLVPLDATWIYLVLGREDDRLVKIFFVAVYVAILLGTYGLARLRTSRVVAVGATALLSSVPALAFRDRPPGIAAHAALADVPLALLTLLSLGLTVEALRRKRRSLLLVAGVLGGFAMFTKQEGALVVAFGGAVVLGWALRRRPGPRAALSALAATLLAAVAVVAPWQLSQSGVPMMHDLTQTMDLSLSNLLGNLARVPSIALRFLEEFARIDLWNLFWPIVGLSVLLAPRMAWRNQSLLFFLLVAFHLLAFGTIFLLDAATYRTYELWMDISLARLLQHVVPLATLVVALQAEGMLKAAYSSRGAPPAEGR